MLHWAILRWAGESISAAWLLWGVVWVITATRSKPALQRENAGSRILHVAPLIASAILLLLAKRTRLGTALVAAGPPSSWLYGRFIAFYPGVVWVGAPLVWAGIAISLWARFHLARNWSATVTLQQDHELIRTGPYRLVRHPIYTGALIAVAGTACAIGQWRGVLAFALTFGGLWYKSGLEEQLMEATFGEGYRRYRSQVKRLIPFIL